MTEPKQVWMIPLDSSDMAPLPALYEEEGGMAILRFYDRRTKAFAGFIEEPIMPVFDKFEECRAYMIESRTGYLENLREEELHTVRAIEHLKLIFTAQFPDVIREVPEAQQEQQEAEGQEKAEAEKVKPAKAELRRPTRRA